MESGRKMREWLEGLDPGEFREISGLISDIQRERAEARHLKLQRRRSVARERAGKKRYLRLEHVRCGKKGCSKCASGKLHGPYWYLYRPKRNGTGRTSEYIGKTLPPELAEEFHIPEDQQTSN